MRAILQRVSAASVEVDGEVVGEIGRGLLVLVGVEEGDGDRDIVAMARKIAGLRVFPDAQGRMNLDVAAAAGSLLVVSQFTLAASLARGRRPSFDRAEDPGRARLLIEKLMADLKGRGLGVAGGRFGAHMEVKLTNDGPVTFCVDVREGKVL